MKRTQVKINVIFKADMTALEVEKTLIKSFEKAGLTVLKFRYTYVETQHGIADFPPELVLASFMSERGGFGCYLTTLTGRYLLKFKA